MKLEDQVVSLELAKRLKKLGVKQGSLYKWVWIREEGDEPDDDSSNHWELETGHGRLEMALCRDSCSAFTVAELYKIHCEIDPHACYRFPEGIEPEKLADWIAEEIIREKSKV